MKENRLPIIPLREIVVFPEVITPILVGRARSLSAVQEAMITERKVIVVAQKDSANEEVRANDLYRIGTVAKVIQLLRLPEGTMKVLIEGESRAEIKRFFFGRDYMEAVFEIVKDQSEKASPRAEALARKTLERFNVYSQMEESVPPEIVGTIESYIENPGTLADIIAAHISMPLAAKQKLLECFSPEDRLGNILAHLSREVEILRLQADIDKTVSNRISDSQREYYLREQLETIRKELGSDLDPEIAALRKKAKLKNLKPDIMQRLEEEFERLERMHPSSPESAVTRNYIDWIMALPWGEFTEDNTDIDRARKILDDDHFGLDEIKERITEHIAVMALSSAVKGPILCLVGPPGVGKTSLGKSIARALGRKFVRVSLGGVRDEAEIRGHRKTYVGSLPGRIIQQLKVAGSSNPVFLLDEIDKLGTDFRGDPASALLEALDPEQNSTFVDHYLEVEFDLSKVLFITTANTTAGIPPALIDRMEIVRIPGYLITEKKSIAKGFLIPKLRIENGLDKVQIRFTSDSIRMLVRGWTQEAGVRGLERKLGKIMRVIASKIVKKKRRPTRIDISAKDLIKYVGIAPFRGSNLPDVLSPGEALGLAWTSYGGEVLRFETAMIEGEEELVLTGRLGDVMKESAKTALTFVKKRLVTIGFEKEKIAHKTIHIHVPEGAVPKDGPSAGICIASALFSLFLNKAIRSDTAMTGEITLTGRVLRIGGLVEKLVAAKRLELKRVIIPKENFPELPDISDEIKAGLDIKPVTCIDEVFGILGLN
ncbi:endopeptidase La [bacterium]|nr:endopeptidase La [bacterium]